MSAKTSYVVNSKHCGITWAYTHSTLDILE